MPKFIPGTNSAHSKTPDESQIYQAHYRAVARDAGVRVFSAAQSLDIHEALSFDVMSSQLSAVDHMVSALLSEIILVITEAFAEMGEELMDVEARATIDIADPLVAARVKGIDGTSRITQISIHMYMFTFIDASRAVEIINDALRRAVIYQSLLYACNISLICDFAE